MYLYLIYTHVYKLDTSISALYIYVIICNSGSEWHVPCKAAVDSPFGSLGSSFGVGPP